MMTRTIRNVAALTAGAATLFTLTACSGGGPSGTYYKKYEGTSALISRLVIDGESVTYEGLSCSGRSSGRSEGTLNDSKDTVLWTEEGNFEDSTRLVTNSDGDTVRLGKLTFAKEDSDAGQSFLDYYEEWCIGNDSDWKNPL